jgi:hypothetical protein
MLKYRSMEHGMSSKKKPVGNNKTKAIRTPARLWQLPNARDRRIAISVIRRLNAFTASAGIGRFSGNSIIWRLDRRCSSKTVSVFRQADFEEQIMTVRRIQQGFGALRIRLIKRDGEIKPWKLLATGVSK